MARKGNLKSKNKKSKENIERPIRFRKYKMFFLIVCEDEKTEPKYFEQFIELFPEYSMYVKAVGTGRDPLGVIISSIDERKRLEKISNKKIDYVWAVFDKDDADENQTKIDKFNLAFKTAGEAKIHVAYSNEAFELWLLLHLIHVDKNKPIPRSDVYAMIESKLKEVYDKDYVYYHGDDSIIDLIKKFGSERSAIKRAKYLLNFHKSNPPIEANPSTKVHLLVEELRAWIKFYEE